MVGGLGTIFKWMESLINIRHGKTEVRNYVRLISKRNDLIRKDLTRKDLNGRNQDCVRLKRKVEGAHNDIYGGTKMSTAKITT